MPSPSVRPAEAANPEASVWALLGRKAGDNGQVLALADSLGVPYAECHLRYRPTELLSNLLLGPNLHGVRESRRRQFRPPWPRLVITAGRRNEPVARWIRQQAAHPVRLVHIGRPWARPSHYDLIVTTPQYNLAGRDNVVVLELPLERAAATVDTSIWSERLASLPAPRIAVLVGGESGMFQLDADKARQLARAANDLAAGLGGSLLVTTSPRTPAGIAAVIEKTIGVPATVYEWRPGATDNPYGAFLALADRLVVTGESISMLAEACATRRPVYIFDMHDRQRAGMSGRLQALGNALRYRALTHHLAQRLAPSRMRRDVSRMHEALIRSGRAVWLGEAFPDVLPPPLPDTGHVTARVRALLEDAGPGG